MYTKNKNMAIISSYPLATPDVDDYVVGTKLQTQGANINPTKNFTIRGAGAAPLNVAGIVMIVV